MELSNILVRLSKKFVGFISDFPRGSHDVEKIQVKHKKSGERKWCNQQILEFIPTRKIETNQSHALKTIHAHTKLVLGEATPYA